MKDIFDRLKAGEPVHPDDPEFFKVDEIVNRTLALSPALNAATGTDQARVRLGGIIGVELNKSITVFPPFHTNFGQFIRLGKNVFINHACSFLDMGGITLEDGVLIGPRANLITENHPIEPAGRRAVVCKPILVRRKAWIGAGATILPGVVVGENAVVAAGAVVTSDVPDNTVVAGVPAKVIRSICN